MKDRFGREVLGLRISVTERCNLRCFYCHKEGCQPTEDEISAEEIGMIAAVATSLGIKKFKLTGGEPLLRNDLAEIIRKISQHKVDDLALTTNGVMLAQMADELAESGLMRVNISLDTLDREKFKRITGADALEDVLRGIKAAAEAGLKPVKINMVLLAGINENEVEKMISFAAEHDAVLQLIELIDLNGD
ncbi:MAG: GTP 3',8-cyclase MoaA [Candidatus Hadarchaeales archaeon]